MSQKQKEKFENQWKELTQMLNNPSPEKVGKVKKNEVLAIFEEITKEREEKARSEFKMKLTGILEAKVALDKNLKKGQEELKNKEEKEYETLNNELNKAFSMLTQIKEEAENLLNEASGNFKRTEE